MKPSFYLSLGRVQQFSFVPWGRDVHFWTLTIFILLKLHKKPREVHEWMRVVEGLNRSMIDRSQKGMHSSDPDHATVNPIEQKDLDNLRKDHPDKASPINLPPGFGFDKVGLVVHEQYAVPASLDVTKPDGPEAPARPAAEVNTSEFSHVIADSPRSATREEMNSEDVLDDALVNGAIDHFLTAESDGESSTSRVQPTPCLG
jgi:hypothetical protein